MNTAWRYPVPTTRPPPAAMPGDPRFRRPPLGNERTRERRCSTPSGGPPEVSRLSGAATLRPPTLLGGVDHHDRLRPPFTCLHGDERFRPPALGIPEALQRPCSAPPPGGPREASLQAAGAATLRPPGFLGGSTITTRSFNRLPRIFFRPGSGWFWPGSVPAFADRLDLGGVGGDPFGWGGAVEVSAEFGAASGRAGAVHVGRQLVGVEGAAGDCEVRRVESAHEGVNERPAPFLLVSAGGDGRWFTTDAPSHVATLCGGTGVPGPRRAVYPAFSSRNRPRRRRSGLAGRHLYGWLPVCARSDR